MRTPSDTLKKKEINNNKQENIITSNKIKNDLSEYFQYINLLSKKRPPANVKLIENYIKQEKNILQRICFIENIDRKEQKLNRIEINKKQEQKKLKKTTTKKLEKVSIIKYILSTRRTIQKFGVRTNIIEPSLILSSKLTNKAYKQYQEYLTKIRGNLIKPISYIVDHGWQHLELNSYNIIATFHRFLSTLLKENNILQYNNINNIYSKMEQFIHPYLQIVSNTNNVHSIRESIYETLFFVPEFKNQFRNIAAITSNILDTDSRKISFFNIILAIVMLKYRSFSSLPKILAHYNVPEIDNKYYELNQKIILNIQKQIKLTKKPYLDSERELFFLQFIENRFYNNGKINKRTYIYLIFSKIYCAELLIHFGSIDNIKHSRGEENLNFINHLKEDMTYTILRFIKGFILAYSSFLSGEELTLESKTDSVVTKKLFAKWLFIRELERLEDCQLDLISFKENNAYLSVQWNTYEKYNSRSHFETTKEEKLCSLLRQVVAIIYSIANKSALILYRHYKASSLDTKEKLRLTSTQYDTIKDIEPSPRFIPYSTYFIKGNPYLEELSVMETLNELTSFTVNFCSILKYNPLTSRAEDKEKHLEKIENFFSIHSKLPHIRADISNRKA